MTSSQQDRDRILLNVLRGCTAMYVVLYHCFEGLTRNGGLVETRFGSAHLIISQFGTGVLGYGHYAVLVFFVLSGYVIHLRQARHRVSIWPQISGVGVGTISGDA